jgi:hypothetical protein
MGKHTKITAGMVYGRLTTISVFDIAKRGTRWLCKCECGKTVYTDTSKLNSGAKSSCGCLAREGVTQRNHRHGHYADPLYRIWWEMQQRCFNPNNKAFVNYGGRGITCSVEWASFETFRRDMGTRPHNHSLERKDNNAGYSKSNCVWATRQEQSRNKRTNVYITYGGKDYILTDLAIEKGFNKSLLRDRLKRGWSIEKAVEHPIQPNQRKG